MKILFKPFSKPLLFQEEIWTTKIILAKLCNLHNHCCLCPKTKPFTSYSIKKFVIRVICTRIRSLFYINSLMKFISCKLPIEKRTKLTFDGNDILILLIDFLSRLNTTRNYFYNPFASAGNGRLIKKTTL